MKVAGLFVTTPLASTVQWLIGVVMLAEPTGITETELFAQTYKSYGLATVRHPVLELEARVEPFENGRGHSLRVLAARGPRTRGERDE